MIHFWETMALLFFCRWEPSSRRVQCEIRLQPEGSGAHAAAKGGGGKRLVLCEQQVWPQSHTPTHLWNHPASASPHWPGGVLWPAGEQLRALCDPSALRGGGVRAGLSLCLFCFCLMCHQGNISYKSGLFLCIHLIVIVWLTSAVQWFNVKIVYWTHCPFCSNYIRFWCMFSFSQSDGVKL